METKRRALGMGLEQLFNSEQISYDTLEQEIVESVKKSDIIHINVDEIRSNPYQPRTKFDEEGLKELAESIKQYGVLEPIIVKKGIKGYELVAGERRTRASKLAGVETIPAIIKEFTDQEMMDIAILENIQREDLSPIELAEGFSRYIKQTGLTQEEMAKKFGKSRSYITNVLGLLSLPTDVKDKIKTKELSASHARVLSKLDDSGLINTLMERVVKEDLSVRELENICSDDAVTKKKPVVKKTKSKSLRYSTYENVLRDLLGCKVQISNMKITIPFDSDGDLARIFEILNVEVNEDEL